MQRIVALNMYCNSLCNKVFKEFSLSILHL